MASIPRLATALLALALSGAAAAADDAQRVRLSTTLGDIVIELDAERAPASSENFLTYTRDGFYDGTIFHRVINGFMIQGGGFGADFSRKRTRPAIKNEANNGLRNVRGSVSMARTGDPHSATSQFFINVVDNASLDHRSEDQRGWGYAVFGQVVEGMEVIDQIRKVPTGRSGRYSDVPTTPVLIETARVVEPTE